MKTPTISVLMPAYNHEAFISEAIESVLSQTYEDFEFIIINDGSTDGTDNIIRGYDDSRISYYYQENQGTAETINRGLELSRGNYISIINSDDIYLKDRLETLLHIAQEEDLNFLITDISLIDERSELILDPDHWWIKWYEYLKSVYLNSGSPVNALLAGNYTISTSNFFFRKEILEKIGWFKPFKYISDYDFAFRIASYEPRKFKFIIDKRLLLYRLHDRNTILKNPLAANYETFYFLINSMKKVFGENATIPMDHINKIKKYIVKELSLRHKSQLNHVRYELNESKKIYLEVSRELDELKLRNAEVSRELEGLKLKHAEVSRELEKNHLFNNNLLEEFYFWRNSISFKIGSILTYPLRRLRDVIQRYKRIKIFKFRVSSTEELQLKIKRLIEDIEVISFDIFDTIFERDIDPPDKVKEIVARDISSYLKTHHNMDISPCEILELRSMTEKKLRTEAMLAGKDYECRYDDIIRSTVISLTGRFDEKLYKEIIKREIDTEIEVLYIKKGMRELLRWLRDQGKRVIAISDMYLNKEYIMEILRAKDLEGFFTNIYVSSDDCICKYSGRLFKYVMIKERVIPSRMVHIGDNRTSDHKIPARLGINTIYLWDKSHLRKKYILKTYNKLAAENIYWKGRHLLQLIRPPLEKKDFFYDYGFSFLGPVYSTFIYGVISKIKEKKINNLFFIAREGELFMKLFRVFSPHFFGDQVPDMRYVYLTRKSTALASAYTGLSHEKAIIALYNPKQKGLYSILNVFGLPLTEFLHIARRHEFHDIEEPIYNWHDQRLLNFLGDHEFQDKLIKFALKDRELLERYLNQEGFFGSDKVAFIDIGWNATIQKFIQDAFIERKDYPHVYGFYLGFRDGIKHNLNREKNTIEGILYDERNNSPCEQVMSRFEEIFEEGARALHPTTIGYRVDNKTNVVVPIFKDDSSLDRTIEIQHNKKIEMIQEGVLDFSKEFIRAIRVTGYSFEEIRPFVLTLIERCVAYPDEVETDNLLNLTHSEDFGYENVMDFNSDRISNLKFFLKPHLLFLKIRTSNWAFGTARSTQIPGINIFLRLYDIMWRPHR